MLLCKKSQSNSGDSHVGEINNAGTFNEPQTQMLCKVTHCAGCVLANTRPHQLRCGNWEMRTAISSTECSLVDACVGLQNCCHQLNSSVHSHSNVRTAHMGQPCLDPQATVQSKKSAQNTPRNQQAAPVDTQQLQDGSVTLRQREISSTF